MPYHRQLTQFRANMHLNRKNDHSDHFGHADQECIYSKINLHNQFASY